MADIKQAMEHDLAQTALWALAFVSLCVLVGLGKIKPEVVELMLMAIIGRAASTRGSKADGLGPLKGSDEDVPPHK